MAQPKKKLAWLNEYWRPTAAVVYLVICVCDFIIFPWLFGLRAPTPAQIALAVKDLDPAVGAVIAAPRPQWQPLTLMGSGLFHVAFGAIVGITAWTRGAAHIEGIRSKSLESYNGTVDQMGQPTYQPQYNPYSTPYQGQYSPYQQPYGPQSPYGQQPYNQQNPGPAANATGEEIDNPDI